MATTGRDGARWYAAAPRRTRGPPRWPPTSPRCSPAATLWRGFVTASLASEPPVAFPGPAYVGRTDVGDALAAPVRTGASGRETGSGPDGPRGAERPHGPETGTPTGHPSRPGEKPADALPLDKTSPGAFPTPDAPERPRPPRPGRPGKPGQEPKPRLPAAAGRR
ncbi:hypothetical protein [Micromonospora sp. NPDC049679]|uniref:hypothetical protein n=1 Tax=Micromonospora sp. NPDC049679 TaxID=3155920 RepID=UPI003405D76E